jgi:hypothetical protein
MDLQVNYSDQEVILARKSIFLAGPTPRDEAVHSWRPYAIKLLREMGFDGVVYVPEYETGEVLHNYDNQIEWEWKALDNAGAILFWVPRNLETMPAYTTNVEFGYWVRDDRAFYGRPSSAVLVRYLDSLYKRHHKDRLVYTDLHSLCGRCCDYLQWKTSK